MVLRDVYRVNNTDIKLADNRVLENNFTSRKPSGIQQVPFSHTTSERL